MADHEINTGNDHFLGGNSSMGIAPTLTGTPVFKTKQQAYRFAAWLITVAMILPDEPGEHSFDDVLQAIRST